MAENVDFGNHHVPTTGHISGSSWHDLDGDGVRDSGEPGLPGRNVYLDVNDNGNFDQQAVHLESLAVPQAISDRTTTTSQVVVTGFVDVLSDVNVELMITHTYDADLDVFLVSPYGTRVELFTDVGGSDNDFLDTVLDDQSPFSITEGVAPFITAFRPEGQLADFVGEDPNGIWTLEITDDAARDIGTLVRWGLVLVGQSEPLAVTDALGNYSFADLALETFTVAELLPPLWGRTAGATGTHTVDLGEFGQAENVDFSSYNTQPSQGLLPDFVVLANEREDYLYDWRIDRSSFRGRTLIRFSTAVANIGLGPAELRGGQTYADGTQAVFQRVYDSDGGFSDRLAGTFHYHPQHNHIHFEGYAQYNLRKVTAGNGVGEVVAAGGKTSFCLVDVDPYATSLPGARATARYNSCGQVQGLSVGWADVYGDHLADQWIDITGVPDGRYWLEIIADPDNGLLESDETNNTTRIQIELDLVPGNRTPVDVPVITTTTGETLSVNSSDVPQPIADLTTIRSSIEVIGFDSVLVDVNVTMDVEHTFAADLDVYLISPAGTRVELFTDVGGRGNDFAGTVIDDEAASSIIGGDPPFAGSFRPEGRLSAFDAEDPNGIWTLEITDDARVDVGQLNNWSLRLVG
jgi:subtilisin-like proprotein convertase family protein